MVAHRNGLRLRRSSLAMVLARKDVPTSYHLSVVIDDAEQNITHVTRGRDLMAATIFTACSAFAGSSGTAIFSPRTGARYPVGAVETGRRPRLSGLRQDGYSRDDVIAALPAPIGSGAPLTLVNIRMFANIGASCMLTP